MNQISIFSLAFFCILIEKVLVWGHFTDCYISPTLRALLDSWLLKVTEDCSEN